MPKGYKDYKNTLLIIFIIVVFGGGILIYGWNRLHGRDLIKPPEFDLSVYEDTSWFTDKFEQVLGEPSSQTVGDSGAVEQKFAGEEQAAGYIYLKNSFRQATARATNDLIVAFLADFPDCGGLAVENLEAKDKIEVELPVLNREKILSLLKNTDEIASLETAAPPIWILTLREPIFFGGAAELLGKISPDIKIKTLFSENLEYIARVDYRPLKNPTVVLEKLKKEYSDVVLIK